MTMSGSLKTVIASCVCRLRLTRAHGKQNVKADMLRQARLSPFPPGACRTFS